MICVAISDTNIDTCLDTLKQVELAEIRLDMTHFDDNAIKKVFGISTPAVATCRPDKIGADEQYRQLKLAIESGARYVDIEIEADDNQRNRIIEVAKKHQCEIIISYHNFEKTPEQEELESIIEICYNLGADVAKIAVQVNSHEENARVLALYGKERRLVAIGMGELGITTRVMAPLLGAEFTFAAMDSGLTTAPGQIPYSVMKKAIEKLENLKSNPDE